MSDAQAGAVSNEAGGTQTADQGSAAPQATPSADAPAAAPAPAPAAQDAQQPNADAKPGDTTTDASKDGKPEDGKPADDKPVEYKFELPKDVPVDQASLDKFTEIAKDLKLAPDAAQKVLDFEVARRQAEAEAYASTVKGWSDEVAKDKELGNPENQALARKAVEQFGSPELKELLNSTGFGNHPVLVRAFLKIGKAISEDKVIVGRGDAPPVPSDPAKVLYPNQA